MRAFYYDIICPYAYLAFSRLHRENLFQKNNITLKPILLGGLFKHMQQEPDLRATLSPLKNTYLIKDLKRQAQLWSVPLTYPPRCKSSSLQAMRLLCACDPELRETFTAVLYKAYWQEGRDIEDASFLSKLSRDFLCVEEEAKSLLIKATAEAFSARVFGVPTLALDDKIYFGSDRLELVEKKLGLKSLGYNWKPSSKALDFYFDFTSPYSYLAYVEVEKALDLGVKINFKPIVLGALFKNLGQEGVPMLKAHSHKKAYYLQDMHDWALARGADFIFNKNFPLRSLNSLRVALIEPRTIGPIFKAAWALGDNISDDLVLESILNKAGFSGSELLREAQSPIIKEKLKEESEKAFSLGVFGVPFFGVNNQLIFGQDRFSWLKHELAQK